MNLIDSALGYLERVKETLRTRRMIIRISIFEVTKKISKHEGGTLRHYGKGKNWMEIGREDNGLSQRVVTVKVLNHIPTGRSY